MIDEDFDRTPVVPEHDPHITMQIPSGRTIHLPLNIMIRQKSGSAEHRIFTYQNTYFETPGWDLYLLHHNGKLNRCKYRYRRIKGHGYVPQSFSKYCVGVCLTDDGTLKRNRFKPVLRFLGRSKVTTEVA